jgi:hypothetical protein
VACSVTERLVQAHGVDIAAKPPAATVANAFESTKAAWREAAFE